MNPRKVISPYFGLATSILACFVWIPSAAAETVLKTQRFVLVPTNATTSVQFQVPEPGKVILEATATYPLNRLGLIARGADPNAADLRKDGPTPLRLEFTVTSQNLAKGSTWTVFTTIMGTNGMIYAIPGSAAVGDLKASFAPDAPARKTAMQQKTMPNWSAPAPVQSASPPQLRPALAPKAMQMKSSAPIASVPAGMAHPPAATQPGMTVTAAPKRAQGMVQRQAVGGVSTPLPNPSGFTSTVTSYGDVVLKWNPVPNAIYYNLQGSGVQQVSGMPPNVTGTTYTVKGLSAGNHSWALFAVFSGPSGPHFGDESNPSRTSATVAGPASGRYRVTINGLHVNNATWDTALQTDGKGDEIFLVVDFQELNATGSLVGVTQTRTSFVYGDTNGFPSRIAAGSLSPKGGIRSGDRIPNIPEPWKRYGPSQPNQFPLLVWEGTLVDGQNGALIIPAIWEQDSTVKPVAVFNSTKENQGTTLKPIQTEAGVIDMRAVNSAIVRIESGIINALKSVGGATHSAMDRIFGSLGAAAGTVLGESKDRPIGMTEYSGGYVFDPQVITLTYRTAEASLVPNALQRGPGILELRYVDASRLAGDYTMYVQIERIQ